MTLSTRGRGGREASGFTLIELMVVMMIIAIAAFALRPSFGQAIQGARERNTLRQLVGFFQSARTQSVAKGKLLRVSFEPSEATFYAEIQTDPSEDPTLFDPIALLGRSKVLLPAEVGLARLEIGGRELSPGEPADIYFYPDGRTDGVGLVLSGAYGKDTLIEVSSATGKVRLSDWHG